MVNINVGVQGQQGLIALQQQLRDVHGSLQAINSISSPAQRGIHSMVGSVVSPGDGMASGRQEMMNYSRDVLDHSRNVRSLIQDYNQLETVINRAATQAGRMAREYEQIRNSFSFAGKDNSLNFASSASDWARGTGISYQQVASSQRSMMESGAMSQQDYYKLVQAVSEGTVKGSTQAYLVSNDRMMAMISSTANAQAARSGTSNVGTLGGVYAAFNATNNPLLRMEAGQGAYQRADQNFAGTRDPYSEAMAFSAMRTIDPNMDYFKFQKERLKGLDSPDKLKALAREYTTAYGNTDQRDFMFANSGYAGNALQAEAFLNVFDKGYLNGGNSAASKMLDPFSRQGASVALLPLAANAAYGQYGEGGKFDFTSAAAEYKAQTGKEFDDKKYGRTQEGFVQGAADFRGQLAGQFSDRTEYTQADISNSYLEASQNFKEAIESVNNLSKEISHIVEGLAKDYGDGTASNIPVIGGLFNPQNAGGVSVAQSVIGGVAGIAGHVLSGLAIARFAAPLLGAGGAGAAATTATGGGVLGATGTALGGIVAAPATAAVAGLAMGGLLGGVSGGIMDRLGGGEGRKSWGTALLGLSGAGAIAPLAVGGGRWLANSGPLKGTGVGNAMNSMDDWTADNLPVFAGIFGRRRGYGQSSSVDPASLVDDKANKVIDVNEEQLRVLYSIDQKLDGPTNQVATDTAYQARYGRGGPTAGASGTSNVYNVNGTISSGGTTPYDGGSGGPKGVPGVGFGPGTRDMVAKELASQGSKINPDTVVAMAEKWGVPVSMALAIMKQESQYGTTGDIAAGFNYGGLTGTGSKGSSPIHLKDGTTLNFAQYGSEEEGLDALFKNMASPLYQGLTLEEYIGLWLTGNKNGQADGDGNTRDQYVANALAVINGRMGGSANGRSTPVGPGGGSVAPGSRTGGRSFFGDNPTITQLPGGDYSHIDKATGLPLNAVDIAGSGSIFAPMGGKITAISNSIPGTTGGTGLGNNITIMGADGVSYTIGHLAGGGMGGLKVGGDIATGQLIGQMGSTGFSDGTHAHVQLNNRSVAQQNALDWLIKNGAIPAGTRRALDGSGGVGGPDSHVLGDGGESLHGSQLAFAPLEVIVRNEAGTIIDHQWLPMSLDSGWTRSNAPMEMYYGKEQVK